MRRSSLRALKGFAALALTEGPSVPGTLDHSDATVISVVVDASADLTSDFNVLDDEERARARRFLRDEDRRRFILSHAALRRLLAERLAVSPGELRFDTGAHGKPFLCGPGGDLRFSLSHSGDQVYLAVARGREVGIDVERWREVDVLALARRFFAATECMRLERLVPSARITAFFRMWTRKESFVKATGRGLSFPLHSVDVDPENSVDPLVVEAAGEDGRIWRWEIRSIDAPDGYSAALTIAC